MKLILLSCWRYCLPRPSVTQSPGGSPVGAVSPGLAEQISAVGRWETARAPCCGCGRYSRPLAVQFHYSGFWDFLQSCFWGLYRPVSIEKGSRFPGCPCGWVFAFVVYWAGEEDGYIKIIHLYIDTVLLSKSVQAFCLLSQNKYKWFGYLPNILTLAYGYIL